MKKYLAYSFGTLWTIVLIIALVSAVVHQVRFQDSAKELHLNWEIQGLENQIQELNSEKERLQSTIVQVLSDPYYE